MEGLLDSFQPKVPSNFDCSLTFFPTKHIDNCVNSFPLVLLYTRSTDPSNKWRDNAVRYEKLSRQSGELQQFSTAKVGYYSTEYRVYRVGMLHQLLHVRVLWSYDMYVSVQSSVHMYMHLLWYSVNERYLLYIVLQ